MRKRKRKAGISTRKKKVGNEADRAVVARERIQRLMVGMRQQDACTSD